MHLSVFFCCLIITSSRQPDLRIIFCSYLARLLLPCLRYYLRFSGIMPYLGSVQSAHLELSRGLCYRKHTVWGNLKNPCKCPCVGAQRQRGRAESQYWAKRRPTCHFIYLRAATRRALAGTSKTLSGGNFNFSCGISSTKVPDPQSCLVHPSSHWVNVNS